MLCASRVSAQDAPVIELKAADAAEAQKLYAQMKAAETAYQQFTEKIKAKYLFMSPDDDDRGSCFVMLADGKQGCTRRGFATLDFIFSADFRFIVPKPVEAGTTQQPCSTYGLSGHNTLSCLGVAW